MSRPRPLQGCATETTTHQAMTRDLPKHVSRTGSMPPALMHTLSMACLVASGLSIAAAVAIWMLHRAGDAAHAERFDLCWPLGPHLPRAFLSGCDLREPWKFHGPILRDWNPARQATLAPRGLTPPEGDGVNLLAGPCA